MAHDPDMPPDTVPPDTIPPDTIPPDNKDWTWVLRRPCPDCGFDAEDLDPTRVGDVIRINAMTWADLLEGGADELAARPRADRWSRLEYGCHVRDVYRIGDQRLERMLAEDSPTFADWDQDATAVADDYRSQDPTQLIRELLGAASLISDRFDAVGPADWSRTGHRSDGADFTVASFARYLVHDPIHHIWDVTHTEEDR